jgi:MFS family permease
MSVRQLEASEKRTLAILGLPTAALALAITVVTTYAPVVAQDFLDSTTVIGGLIAIEGVLALWLPLVIGSWSDRLRTPYGGRLPFMLVGTPLAIVSLAFIGFSDSVFAMAPLVTVFFFAYFIAYEPYRALYPDLIDDDIAARAQSTQAIFRAAGTGIALVGGGMFVAIGPQIPFLFGAGVFAIAMGAFLVVGLRRARRATQGRRTETESVMEEAEGVRNLLRDNPALRSFVAANALWEASLSALKTFVFLYVIMGLDKSPEATAGIIGGVALLALPAAIISGELADHFGRVRVMMWTLPLYGLGLLVPAFTTSIAILIPIMVIVGFGGGLVMTLPYALLQPMMPHGHHGVLTGYYSLSRGIGTALGPLLAGVAIQVLDGPFAGTDGFAAMWLICGGTILLSLPFLHALRVRAGDLIDHRTAASST